MDVMTVGIAIKTAQTAFNFIKKGIDTGREVQDMGQAFGKLFESWNEINQRDIENKNPPVFRKLTQQKSITAEALEIVLAKKKALDQRTRDQESKRWSYLQSPKTETKSLRRHCDFFWLHTYRDDYIWRSLLADDLSRATRWSHVSTDMKVEQNLVPVNQKPLVKTQEPKQPETPKPKQTDPRRVDVKV